MGVMGVEALLGFAVWTLSVIGILLVVFWRRDHAAGKRHQARWAADMAALSGEMYFWRKTVEALIAPATGYETTCPFCGRRYPAATWAIYHIREAHPAGTTPLRPAACGREHLEHPMTPREPDADHGLPDPGAGLDDAASARQHLAAAEDAEDNPR